MSIIGRAHRDHHPAERRQETVSADLFGLAEAVRTVQSHRAGGGSDVWLTPPDLLAALGRFDLDPCAAPEPRPWPTASVHYTAVEDGLRLPWTGRVWLNPPYSTAERWLARLADHGHGTALIFARTETKAFRRQVWERATALRFLYGRVTFHQANGRPGKFNGGAPSVLVAYGPRDAGALLECDLPGAFVHLGMSGAQGRRAHRQRR